MGLRKRLDPGRLSGLFRRVAHGPDGLARVGPRQIYILPTKQGLRFGAVLLVMLLGSLNYQNNLGLLVTFFLASVALVAMHHTWLNLLGLLVRARGGPPVFVGEDATFEIILGTDGRRAREDIAVMDQAGRRHAARVPGGDQARVRISAAAARRGLQRLSEVTLETRHPLHLFRAWCYVSCTATTLVYPAPAAHAPEPSAAPGEGQSSRRQAHMGTDDYLGPRLYRPGDSPRQVDWKAYARERGLVVKQFGADQGREVWIDWDQVSAADPETRISLLTRQLLDAAEAGLRFGLRLPGGTEGLGRGEDHLQRCLTRLALL
ncbi:MAG: DUF58 domain-containing protein [Sphingobacteriia bacterium]|nr:DUF58 domain-containing protein [Sphingobacteriia bacterium]NCC38389.1 DUF58 domain-containing protein [Gammaproteobacteria bacterium]